jgi:hypothetical protein
MKHGKNVVDGAKEWPGLWQVSEVKINYLFLMVGNYDFFSEALQPRFFAEGMTWVRGDDR